MKSVVWQREADGEQTPAGEMTARLGTFAMLGPGPRRACATDRQHEACRAGVREGGHLTYASQDSWKLSRFSPISQWLEDLGKTKPRDGIHNKCVLNRSNMSQGVSPQTKTRTQGSWHLAGALPTDLCFLCLYF